MIKVTNECKTAKSTSVVSQNTMEIRPIQNQSCCEGIWNEEFNDAASLDYSPKVLFDFPHDWISSHGSGEDDVGSRTNDILASQHPTLSFHLHFIT
jgi:hypothetical protein